MGPLYNVDKVRSKLATRLDDGAVKLVLAHLEAANKTRRRDVGANLADAKAGWHIWAIRTKDARFPGLMSMVEMFDSYETKVWESVVKKQVSS